jgi:hypothetical protein
MTNNESLNDLIFNEDDREDLINAMSDGDMETIDSLIDRNTDHGKAVMKALKKN